MGLRGPGGPGDKHRVFSGRHFEKRDEPRGEVDTKPGFYFRHSYIMP